MRLVGIDYTQVDGRRALRVRGLSEEGEEKSFTFVEPEEGVVSNGPTPPPPPRRHLKREFQTALVHYRELEETLNTWVGGEILDRPQQDNDKWELYALHPVDVPGFGPSYQLVFYRFRELETN